MIDSALEFVAKVLNQSLVTRFGLEGNIVVLNNLVDVNGASPRKNQNQLVMTLINLEYETNKQFYGGQRWQDGSSGQSGQFNQLNPAVFFNLDVLFAANFDNYNEALKFLTAAIGFFQENTLLNRTNTPALPVGLSVLKFEIENTPSMKTHNLWTALGAKYLPSIVYKIRHVSVDAAQIKGAMAAVQDVAALVSP